MTAGVVEPVRMSHSRMAQAGRCGEQYRLTRIEGVSERPSVALAAGSAFHKWSEDYDWGGLNWFAGRFEQQTFADVFDEELDKLAGESGLNPSEFKVSGRKTKARPHGEDIDVWRDELGPELCQLYTDFKWPDGWEIATDLPPDDLGRTTGIEYHAELLDPLWQGYYDRIFRDRLGNLIVVDLKTWQQRRTSAQLQEYMVAGQMLGMRTVEGAYYSARKGELDGPHPCKWDAETFCNYVQLHQMNIESGLYLPVVDDHCNWCSVRENCVFAP